MEMKRTGGILGSRDVGKTTFLLHFVLVCGVSKRKALYESADNIYLEKFMNTSESLKSVILAQVIDPAFQPYAIEKTARSYGYNINAEFISSELDELIQGVTKELIKKIELFIKANQELDSLYQQKAPLDLKEEFASEIDNRIRKICKLTTSTRNVPSYSIIKGLAGWFSS